jgi:ribosome-associated protein
MIRIDQRLEIDEGELTFRTSRSSGPGGQHVNRTESRVEVLFDVRASPSLKDRQRARILERLANRINSDGVLSVVSQEHRSQHMNKAAAVERMVELLARALEFKAPRRASKPSRSARRKRTDKKKQRGAVKKLRGRVGRDD